MNCAKGRMFFTSESVTEGHPDKIADQISDAVLDALISKDPTSRAACETMLTTGLAFVAGEIKTDCYVEIPELVRETIKEIGYTRAKYGFDGDTCAVITAIHEQSPDIAQGVDPGGAGDQGLMFGYASDETDVLMPLPIHLAHRLCLRLTEMRKKDILDYLRPDGKSQVTVEYLDGKPQRVSAVVVSSQHAPDVKMRQLKEEIIEKVIKPVIPADLLDEEDVVYHINPTGRFVQGGPAADTGLTGRKIIVDTYGGSAPHGGGAFSGKDPSKVDRSASYMARYIAKNMVAAGLCQRCLIQISYAIGVAQPLSVAVDTEGTGKIPDTRMGELVQRVFDLTPKGIIEALDLRRPIYRKTASYGHFGRELPEFTWEKTDMAETLRSEAEHLA